MKKYYRYLRRSVSDSVVAGEISGGQLGVVSLEETLSIHDEAMLRY